MKKFSVVVWVFPSELQNNSRHMATGKSKSKSDSETKKLCLLKVNVFFLNYKQLVVGG